MKHFALLLLTAACLATSPRPAAAQDGGFPVQTTSRTQFVMQSGEVVRRDGSQTTALTQNVKLSSGVKINYKNGIIEMPADKLNPQGKKITLREGDYVKADGGVVFGLAWQRRRSPGRRCARRRQVRYLRAARSRLLRPGRAGSAA